MNTFIERKYLKMRSLQKYIISHVDAISPFWYKNLFRMAYFYDQIQMPNFVRVIQIICKFELYIVPNCQH